MPSRGKYVGQGNKGLSLPARMKVRRPIMPNWSTTMLAGMFVTRPEKREILRFRANHDDENSQTT